MDIWIIFNPILRVFLYAASFLSVGTLFSLHFSKHLTVAQKSYVIILLLKTALVGSAISLLMFFPLLEILEVILRLSLSS